jgi:hypothetical protein
MPGTFYVGRPLAPNSIVVAEQFSTLLQGGLADVWTFDCFIIEGIRIGRRRKKDRRT